MKEYKLSAKSKYSVLYLLSGLFMFFFMFAILSLNSYASAVSDYVLNITSSNGTFFETSGLYHSFSSSLSHPEYAYPITTVSGSSSFTRPSNVESVNLEVHVVTSEGDFVVDTHQGTGSYESFSSVKLNGYPIGYYGVCKGYLREGTTSTTMTMNVSCSATVANQTTNVTTSLATIQSNTNSILSALGSGVVEYNHAIFSDYSSYSFVNSLNTVPVSNAYLSAVGSSTSDPHRPLLSTAINYGFQEYDGTSLSFHDGGFMIATQPDDDLIFMFTYYGSAPTSLNFLLNGTSVPLSDFTLYSVGGAWRTYYYVWHTPSDVPFISKFTFGGSADSVRAFSFSLMQYKMTLADYMKQQNDNWNNISPSVSDTNTNTAQTVSDIGTVNSFETTTFNNFDTLSDIVGLDSFSLTSETHVASAMNFLSTCIVTVYNDFPSDLKWLIQCIGIFGIFALLLSVFGRVGKRINNE